jgi:hypothetical protein
MGLRAGQGNDDESIPAYRDCILANTQKNNTKGKLIEAAQWTFCFSIASIAILVGWLLLSPISFP